jgi:hypothetical protein
MRSVVNAGVLERTQAIRGDINRVGVFPQTLATSAAATDSSSTRRILIEISRLRRAFPAAKINSSDYRYCSEVPTRNLLSDRGYLMCLKSRIHLVFIIHVLGSVFRYARSPGVQLR